MVADACAHCGRSLDGRRVGTRFCSVGCRVAAHRRRHQLRLFDVHPYRLRVGKSWVGERRFCNHCERWMPEWDSCLGLLPGVTMACCGHGDPAAAFVNIGGTPYGGPQWCRGEPGLYLRLTGWDALRFFELLLGRPAWRTASDDDGQGEAR